MRSEVQKLFPDIKNYKRRPIRISMVRFYALSGEGVAADKTEKANANMGKYTIFVNKAHTLAHIVPKRTNIITRVPIHARLRKESDKVVEAYLYIRCAPYLVGL